jgi:hypothetical protein
MTLAAADAFLHKGLAFTPTIEQYQRDLLRGTLSRDPSVSGQRSAKIAFDCELVGSGTAGTAPYWGKLMKACGYSETIVASTSVTYKPATDSIPSMTLGGYLDGVIKRIWGARGNVSLSIEAGKPGILHFEFEGADFEMVDGALLTGMSYSTIIPPAFLSAALLIDSYAAIVSKVDIDTANVLAKRGSINSPSGFLSTLITGRNPKGSLDPELVTVATLDFYGKWKTPGTLGALSLAATGAAGNIVTITCPKVRYAAIADGDRGGIRTLGIDFQPCLNTGDDEIAIALT